jgi:hypothetical protein
MSCGGSHLGFPIGIKKRNFVEDLPMIIPGQFDFNCPNVSKCFFSDTTRTVETKLPRNDHWKVLYKVSVFLYRSEIFMYSLALIIFVVSEKKAFEHFPIGSNVNLFIAVAGHRLTLDPMGKCSNAFFSETTNMIKAKLYMNVHWMVIYKL